jgi:hypothetical protein
MPPRKGLFSSSSSSSSSIRDRPPPLIALNAALLPARPNVDFCTAVPEMLRLLLCRPPNTLASAVIAFRGEPDMDDAKGVLLRGEVDTCRLLGIYRCARYFSEKRVPWIYSQGQRVLQWFQRKYVPSLVVVLHLGSMLQPTTLVYCGQPLECHGKCSQSRRAWSTRSAEAVSRAVLWQRHPPIRC